MRAAVTKRVAVRPRIDPLACLPATRAVTSDVARVCTVLCWVVGGTARNRRCGAGAWGERPLVSPLSLIPGCCRWLLRGIHTVHGYRSVLVRVTGYIMRRVLHVVQTTEVVTCKTRAV